MLIRSVERLMFIVNRGWTWGGIRHVSWVIGAHFSVTVGFVNLCSVANFRDRATDIIQATKVISGA